MLLSKHSKSSCDDIGQLFALDKVAKSFSYTKTRYMIVYVLAPTT